MSSVATFAAATLGACLLDLPKREGSLRVWPGLFPSARYVLLYLALSFCGEHLGAGLRNPDRLDWARQETFFALSVGAISALAVLTAIRARQPWVQTACVCSLLAISVADFHHAYGDYHESRVSPDECFPQTSPLLERLKNYHDQLGPFRFGQVFEGRLDEELAMHRNQPYFQDFLQTPEGYTSFYLDDVARFQGITNEEAKVAVQNIQVTIEEDAHGKFWLHPCTNSLPRATFYSRIRRYDSSVAALGALERGEIDWHNEAAICELLASGALPSPGQD